MPPSGELLITPARGGKLVVDRVTVEFLAGAVAADTLVRLEALPALPEAPRYLKLAYAFRAQLLHPTTRAEVRTQFARPPQVTLDYSGIAMTRRQERSFGIYAYDESKKQWEMLPSRLDLNAKRVIAQASHFSIVAGASSSHQAPSKPPTLDGFQVDLMTGSASYVFPIEAPPGTGGLAPKLPLTYSSNIMDIMNNLWLQQGGGDNDSPAVQASWVGAGWDLGMGSVGADSNGYPTDLSINGNSYKLVLVASGADWREYRTERNEFWKILFHSTGGGGRSGYWVEGWDKEGTWYRFGFDINSECHDGDWPYRYMLDRVEDTRANYINLYYYTIQKTTYWDPSNQYDQQVYLDYIEYTGNRITGFAPPWRIYFNRRLRDDVERTQYQYWNEYLLDSIDIKKADGTMVRKYVFEYEYGDPYWYQAYSSSQVKGKTKLLLKSITPCDTAATPGVSNGVPSGNTLPKLTFTYHKGQDTDPNPKKNLWMWTGDNGHGGKVTFAFVNDALVEEPRQMLWYHARVSSKTMEDGLGGSSAYTYQYGVLRQESPTFWGHIWTKEIDPEGHWAIHSFYVRHYDDQPNTPDPGQNNKLGQDIYVMRGKRFKLERGASGSGTVISWEAYDWWYRVTNDLGGISCWFVYLQAQDSYLQGKQKRVTYVYDTYGNPNYYDGYGNLKEEYHWGDMAGGGGERRTIHRGYYPNTTVWIVGKVAWAKVYATITGDVGGANLKTETRNYYDSQASFTVPPLKGLVTRVERGLTGQYFVSVQYGYDAYGNPISVTDPNGRTTDTTYEATYHTYPQTISYPSVGGQPRMTETYVYDTRWGKPTSFTDRNGQVALYDYDTFGRLIKVALPLDTLASPTIEYNYRNYQPGPPAQPHRIETILKKNATDPRYYTRTFYDGMGREVQKYSDGVGGWVVVNTHYNGRGLKQWESAPYYLTADPLGNFNSTAWNDTTKPRSQHTYDALRRQLRTTNPDNTWREWRYGTGTDAWARSLVDDNGHSKRYEDDAFGRLVAVKEYTGADPNFTLYSTTAYGYDVLDNLLSIRDHAANTITMTYDALSRKTAMSDPDMGNWSYGYDAAGNLTQITDAKGQTITLTYDELNRPTRKHYGVAWVDEPLTTNHSPGVFDLMELRAAIDVDRIAAGVVPNPYGWNNPAIVAGKDVTIRAIHFNEMRDPAIQGLWNAASMGTVPQFTRGSIQVDPPRLISLQDPQDLRGWLGQYEGSAWAGQNGRRARAVYRYDNYSDATYNPGNSKGRRTEMWDVSGRTRWTYDARGRITMEERWIDGQLYTTQWSYDAMDRVTSITYPDGEVVSYTYNAQLLLASMTGWAQYITGTNYNALGKPTQVVLGNGRVTDIQYCWLEWAGKKPFGAIAWIKTTKAGLPNLQDLQYTYDNMGNPTQIYDPRNGETVNYGYDDLDRLTSASAPINGSYSHNEIGNLLSKTEGGATYNLDYTGTTHKHAPVSVNGVQYTYDANGNLTNRSGIDFKYDAENRLVKVSQGAQYVARFSNDGDGRRAKRLDGYGTVHYVGPHYERNVGTGADTTEVVTKLYWVQLGSYRRLIAVSRAGLLYYVHSDHLGGTNILSDVTGNEVGALRYYAFGQTRVQTGLVPTDKLYTGQTLDASSGLYFYGARYYDPALGRFVQPDSIVPQPGNPQSLNRYSYGYNNPVKYSDPTGNIPTYDDESERSKIPPDVKPADPDWDLEWYEGFKAAHGGGAPTVEDWRDRLLSLRWPGSGAGGAWTEQDWQDYTRVRGLLGALADQIGTAGDLEAIEFYSALGLDLARAMPIIGPDQTLIVRSDRIPPRAGAMTLGRVIAVRPNVSLTRELLIHEYVHVLQYRAYGWKVLPDYLREGPWDWSGNKYEQLAMNVQVAYTGNPYLPPPWAFPRR